MLNVLVTSAGTASAVSVIKALKNQSEIPVKIIAIDADDTAAGLYLADDYRLVPPAKDPAYKAKFFELCDELNISIVFPIYSKEVEVVASFKEELASKNIKTLLSAPDVIRLCNDKNQMQVKAESLGLITPKLISNPTEGDVPFICKPNSGSGTTNVTIVNNADEFIGFRQPKNSIVQQFVSGPEFTVDCLADQNSNIIVASPRSRLLVKAGQAVKARTEPIPILSEYCAKIASGLRFVGPFNVQFIQKGDTFYFIEINPRYAAGGLMLTVHAGANIPLLSLKMMLGMPIPKVEVRHFVMMVRYWEEVFLENR